MMYHPKQPRAPEGQQIGKDGDDRKPLLDRLEGGQFKMRLSSAQGTIQEPVHQDWKARTTNSACTRSPACLWRHPQDSWTSMDTQVSVEA